MAAISSSTQQKQRSSASYHQRYISADDDGDDLLYGVNHTSTPAPVNTTATLHRSSTSGSGNKKPRPISASRSSMRSPTNSSSLHHTTSSIAGETKRSTVAAAASLDDIASKALSSSGNAMRLSSTSVSLLNNLSNMIQSTLGHSLNVTTPLHASAFAPTAATDNEESEYYPSSSGVAEEEELEGSLGVLSFDENDESFDIEAERILITNIDRKSASLQRKGNHIAALELLEQGLISRRKVFGIDSIEVLDASEKVALMYNSIAMSLLYQADYERSLDLLRRADLLTSGNSSLVSVRVQTLNNLACCYRRMKKPRTALNLLRESLAIISAERELDGRAVTHLNMCAILSQLNRHAEALEHANAAVIHCQKQLLSTSLREQLLKHHDQHALLTEKIVVLGIAYHNLGVEEEFLGNFERCLQWYQKALQLARDHLGPDEDITRTFEESYVAAKKQVGSAIAATTSTVASTTSGRNSTTGSRRTSAPGSARQLSRSASLSSSTASHRRSTRS